MFPVSFPSVVKKGIEREIRSREGNGKRRRGRKHQQQPDRKEKPAAAPARSIEVPESLFRKSIPKVSKTPAASLAIS
ncbi:hypothetical protein AKJ37_06855 [candidate division MSBL1 archaeon SCGC-AAA259I09]|uniref:Uncharacterized protein n=1 Tax=candidate division MSBL1 archaeon SCGC-AAA259I09 TaxID=1698267 RepID=A0A133UMF5_9EURY|nr:hypothetical protein AKJ37_06855 [candidate division MSBL1 archaeon SCGC-AAA259I09]